MRLLLALCAAALVASGAFAAEPARRLSVDSTLLELARNETTAAVLRKRMPGLVEGLQNEETATIFGGSTLRDLVVDPHFRGLTPAVVEKIDLEFAAAQAAAPPVAQTPSR